MSDDPLTTCPKCGEHIRRVLFPAGIVFKGSGFYKTDHANGSVVSENGNVPKSDEAAKEGESKPAATESKSSESKSGESSSGTSGENKVTVEAK